MISSVMWLKCVFDFHSSADHPTKCLLEIMLSAELCICTGQIAVEGPRLS